MEASSFQGEGECQHGFPYMLEISTGNIAEVSACMSEHTIQAKEYATV